jgi:hypothetical protein
MHARPAFSIRLHESGKQPYRDRPDKADAQVADVTRLGGLRNRLDLRRLAQAAPRDLQRSFSRRSEAHTARPAHEQKHADFLLQLADSH